MVGSFFVGLVQGKWIQVRVWTSLSRQHCPFSLRPSGPPLTARGLCVPAGHGDYAYQQSSYTEQSYDRSFEESTQHYYEGGKERKGRAASSEPDAHLRQVVRGCVRPRVLAEAANAGRGTRPRSRRRWVEGA